MRKIEMYKTSIDGKLHESKSDAIRHLDKMYGDKISKIAANMTDECSFKFTKLRDYIDTNLILFLELQRIKDDMQLAEEDE